METQNLNQSLSYNTQKRGMEMLPRPMMSFKEAVNTCFAKYIDFHGRARRSEFWWFSLFCLLVTVALFCPIAVLSYLEESQGISMDAGLWALGYAISAILALIGILFIFAILIPSLSVEVRRLHDIGRSGWWVFWSIVISIVASAVPFSLFDFRTALDLGEIESFTKAFDLALLPALIMLVPKLGNWILEIVLLVFTLLDSHEGENQYGRSPKYQ